MRGILLLLAVCAVATAMVPRDRRAVNPDSEEAQAGHATTEKEKKICAAHTPCAWSIYKPILKIIEMNITNTYCECGIGDSCQYDEDDSTVNAYVYRCRTAPAPDDTPATEENS